ncbi:MAG: energy-coupled thiamine transporter ThiT [Oscillospiraceae bacterium]|nr:energy-coupled thiamine transporter ThiT [Oscillospiraceae bacterium]
MKNNALRALTEGGIMVAAAMALSYLKLFELPQGGSVCIGMLPIFLYCVRWGLKDGLLCSLAYGILQLIFDGAYAWGWTSMLLDYVVAFSVLGFAGLFARQKYGVFVGTVVGCLLRFIVHFISGVTIYRIYEPVELFNTTFANPYLYSAAYNGSYVAIDMALCLVIFALLYKPMKKYFLAQDLAQ